MHWLFATLYLFLFLPMPLYVLDDRLWFPPVEQSLPDGLLALGGDLSVERLLLAYQRGIFPWFDGDVPLWWSPDPRFVLFPSQIKVSKSMQVLLKKNLFAFTTNKAFEQVIHACRQTPRQGQDGTWITDALLQSFLQLHDMGYAHSAEVWQNGTLVGGLYGIRMQQMFFGESMFSLASNASKFAFIRFVDLLKQQGVQMIDCQVYTAHLESLGATMIERHAFLKMLSCFV